MTYLHLLAYSLNHQQTNRYTPADKPLYTSRQPGIHQQTTRYTPADKPVYTSRQTGIHQQTTRYTPADKPVYITTVVILGNTNLKYKFAMR